MFYCSIFFTFILIFILIYEIALTFLYYPVFCVSLLTYIFLYLLFSSLHFTSHLFTSFSLNSFVDVKGALPFVRLLHCATSRINRSEVDLRTIYKSMEVLERSKVEEKVRTFYSRPVLSNRLVLHITTPLTLTTLTLTVTLTTNTNLSN